MEDFAQVFVLLSLDVGPKADALLIQALFNNFFQPVERAAADKEDVLRVHLDEFLMGMLPAALGRNVGHGPLHNFQQRLLHPLPGNVPGNGGIFALPGNFVDFIHIDDAVLSALHVEVRRLKKAEEDVLHVVAHVARLGEGGGVGNGEGHF